MSTRIQYIKELEKLNQDVLDMSSEISNAIEMMSEALQSLDASLSVKIMDGDDVIDHMERSIEKYCIDLVIKEAPVASDWRKIASIMRIVADLERIADHCSDIAGYVIKLSKESKVEPPIQFNDMIKIMKSMLSDTINAFITLDTALAVDVVDRDEFVDQLFNAALDEISLYIKAVPDSIEQYTSYILISKYIERMADHAVNVAKWIPYIASGEYKL